MAHDMREIQASMAASIEASAFEMIEKSKAETDTSVSKAYTDNAANMLSWAKSLKDEIKWIDSDGFSLPAQGDLFEKATP